MCKPNFPLLAPMIVYIYLLISVIVIFTIGVKTMFYICDNINYYIFTLTKFKFKNNEKMIDKISDKYFYVK
jgi:hypothetical protein